MSYPEPDRRDEGSIEQASVKQDEKEVEYVDVHEHGTGAAPQMRSKMDDLSIWESVKAYKLVTAVAMAAALSASLDGYRKLPHKNSLPVIWVLTIQQ